MSGIAQKDVLPEEFLQFLSKNYKTINDIERKILQFQNDSWSEFYKKLGCRNWRNMRLRSTKCDSVDSCFNDKDIKRVIRAKLRPKMKKMESNEQIDIDEESMQGFTSRKKDTAIDYTYLVQNFPLAYFSPDLCNGGGRDETKTSKDSSVVATESSSVQSLQASNNSTVITLMVEGSSYPITQRTATSTANYSSSKDKGKANSKVAFARLTKNNAYNVASDCSSDESSSVILSGGHGAVSIKKRESLNDGEPPSRQLLTLTLPPLHQSVLTLLGQKSGVKSSPRNHVIHDLGSAFDASDSQKTKKLRRHGRKKKAKDEGKESEEKEIEKPEPTYAADGRGDNDELQETQLNTLHNGVNINEDEDSAGVFIKSPTYMKEIKSLRDVLDEHLCREQWSQKEMECLNKEIEKLSVGLKKYQTEFKSKSISMTEESWLAFPRTCTHTTATFGVPFHSKVLKDLTPLEYLKNYVTILEPRLHLYKLIYQRYRILENPTGTCITVKSLQRALTEVLGRPFEEKELQELQNVYLQLKDNQELDCATFAGICAFSERIFGKYKLENCKDCFVCSKQKVADKERCHMKRKSVLEDIDLAHLSNKIRFGETSDSMAMLIQALTNDEHVLFLNKEKS